MEGDGDDRVLGVSEAIGADAPGQPRGANGLRQHGARPAILEAPMRTTAVHSKKQPKNKESGNEMEIELKTRIVRSMEGLDRLLDQIESGRAQKPDWIELQGMCRLDRLERDARQTLLGRLHASVLRGFRAKNVRIGNGRKRVAYWRSVASAGFHDFSDLGWMKCYDSPFVQNYDYIGPYLEGGLDALDPYDVYSAVLGTFEFGVEDFVATELCRDVATVVEPMAGTAEFSYFGHFRYPDFRFAMIDLDGDAQTRVLNLPWQPQTEKHYFVADVLDESVWRKIAAMTHGKSLCYIGKQSHHLFDAKQLLHLMQMATRHVDYFMLETPELVPVMDMGGTDDMTRPEMQDAGFEVELVEEPDGEPNPLTNVMHFRLDASDKSGHRTLFRYGDWTVWQQPILVTLARLLDLSALYYHSELNEFVPVEEGTEDSDVLDNVTFMIFTRHPIERAGARGD